MEKRDKRKSGGFTLVEVLVVMVIIAVMAAITIPNFIGYIEKARQKTYLIEARTVSVGVQTYIAEQYALGDLNRNQVKKDLMEYEMGDSNHALTELLRGSYTDGAKIVSVTVQTDTGEYGGIEYEVDGYGIILNSGEAAVIKKLE